VLLTVSFLALKDIFYPEKTAFNDINDFFNAESEVAEKTRWRTFETSDSGIRKLGRC
jgi:hypothetical protein